LSAVAGWGHKPTARRARAVAARRGLSYLALEDGFLRSRRPGPGEASLSYVCDAQGVYYDAAAPSGLEARVADRVRDPEGAARDAEPALHAIRVLGLSKYAEADADARDRLLRAAERARPVIVVDQTLGDAAVTGAGADRATFRAMLVAAVEENPDCPVLLKVHPETRLGRRAGYFDAAFLAEIGAAAPAVAEAAASGRLGVLSGAVAPRDVAAAAERVYAVSSLLGFEALIAGAPVTVFGRSFYAGWGLTDDRAAPVPWRAPASLACLAAAAYCDYAVYLSDPGRRRCTVEEAIERLARRVS
jgi:capsule polysaccharide export protein KpsC/LpsZ